MSKSINDHIREIHATAVEKGWWSDSDIAAVRGGDPRHIAASLCLIHSEVSEALECVRDGDMVTTSRFDGKPEGFPSELADVVIRSFDLAGAMGIDLEHEVELKAAFNRTRKVRHGGKVL
jgi:NTP pyrophosphatase (non-canonical NTP hydrolase)